MPFPKPGKWVGGGGALVARLCAHATRQSLDLGNWF